MDEVRFRNFVRSLKEIPTLPAIAMKVARLCEDESSTVDQLEAVIASDPAISARILRIANSAFFGHSHKVDSIARAIVLLGFDTVKSLALSTSVFNLFAHPNKTRLDHHEFWLHSIACGRAAQLIAQDSIPRAYHSSIFLAGLLHDIGKLILDYWFTEQYSRVLEDAKARQCCLWESEDRILGFDHAAAGGWLAKGWGLPDSLADPIARHHTMDMDVEARALGVAAVHIADRLCHTHHLGSGVEAAVPPLDPHAVDVLKLAPGRLESHAIRLSDEESEIRAFLELL